jgi:hypothetical protein
MLVNTFSTEINQSQLRPKIQIFIYVKGINDGEIFGDSLEV